MSGRHIVEKNRARRFGAGVGLLLSGRIDMAAESGMCKQGPSVPSALLVRLLHTLIPAALTSHVKNQFHKSLTKIHLDIYITFPRVNSRGSSSHADIRCFLKFVSPRANATNPQSQSRGLRRYCRISHCVLTRHVLS